MSVKFITFLILLLSATGLNAAGEVRYEFSDSTRSIMRVGPNQSLDDLVQQMYPQNKPLWPRLKKELKARNPAAFSKYTGQIIVGKRLKLVTIRKFREGSTFALKQAGVASSVHGKVIALDKKGHKRNLEVNSELFEGDRITTSIGATAVVKMIDDAEMYIKQDSSLKITEYSMKSGFEGGSTSVIDLIRGGLRKITGAIGANPLSVYRFQTGVMTIGVRGTDYVIMLCDKNDCEKSASRNSGDPWLHTVVLDGLIVLQDEEGDKGELILGEYAVATPDSVVKVNDSKPSKGLLGNEESEVFAQLTSPGSDEKEEGFWPWLFGSGLLLIGI